VVAGEGVPQLLPPKDVDQALAQDIGWCPNSIRAGQEVGAADHDQKFLAQAFADQGLAENAFAAFDRAFNRWRGLYLGAQDQLKQATDRGQQTGLSAKERDINKTSYNQASEQLKNLEQGRQSNGSDFYSYRYLATEGFLPGYNFPRLPLYAWVSGAGGGGAFLQHAWSSRLPNSARAA
jgi:hypothetical protein